jgi:hypothetical protein
MIAGNLVIGYLQTRKIIGFLGILLPLILLIGNYLFSGCSSVQMSLSQYYYTNMSMVFTGILFAISIFLFSYKGYSKHDNLMGNIASVFGIGIAVFPTNMKTPLPPCNFSLVPDPFPIYFQYLHTGCAIVFFSILAYFSIVLFTKSNEQTLTEGKKNRNKLYKTCGYVIIGCLIILALIQLIEPLREFLKPIKPIFVLEAIILWAFGLSWLVKGEFLMKD